MINANIVGPWPVNFPLLPDGKIEEGLVVLSRDGLVEGRSTGSRQPCRSTTCEGWFIGVNWESGQMMFPCSKGWAYDPATREVRITEGGNISARVNSVDTTDIPALPLDEWPKRSALHGRLGWRVGPST